MITITLQPSEILNAALLGCMRNIQSWKHCNDKHGAETNRNGWQINIIACLGEMAWAKHKSIYYNAAIGNWKASDVGHYEIRSTPLAYKEKGASLRVHRTDHDDKPYILALVGMSTVEFVGWLYGEEAKQKRYWGDRYNNGRPAFFVPINDLHLMEDLQ